MITPASLNSAFQMVVGVFGVLGASKNHHLNGWWLQPNMKKKLGKLDQIGSFTPSMG